MQKQIRFAIITIALLTLGTYSVYSIRTASTVPDALPPTQTVVTSFYPLQYFTERITQDADIAVVNLAGARDAHDYTPTRADLEQMLHARSVIVQGASMEPWVEDMEVRLAETNIPLLVVAEHLPLRKVHAGSNEHTEYATATHEDRNDNEHPTPEIHSEERTGEELHEHGAYDPHTWLDPVLAQNMVTVILDELVRIFPEKRTILEDNAARLMGELETLHIEYATRLEHCAVVEAFISHDAAGYLADRYELHFNPIAGISTEDEPSAQLLAELAQEASAVRAILVEQGTPTAYAEALARETGLATLPWNPLGRGTLSDELDYLDVMRANLSSFTTAFECSAP